MVLARNRQVDEVPPRGILTAGHTGQGPSRGTNACYVYLFQEYRSMAINHIDWVSLARI